MAKNIVALDVGGTHIRFAKLEKGKITHFSKTETPEGKEDLRNSITNGIDQHFDRNTIGIGVSFAGVVIYGRIVEAPNLGNAENWDLQAFLAEKYGIPARVENDSNCFALAEFHHGAKKHNMVVLTLGTGIGGGIIADGKLYKGTGGAGELGHMIVHKGKDLEHWYKKKKNSVKEQTKFLGVGISNIASILAPEEIIINGGAKKSDKDFLEKIKYYAEKYKFVKKLPKIKYSKVNYAGLKGAASLVE
ncbi:MAG: ROK family protein [Candidatus Paceibacteria bacterium]